MLHNVIRPLTGDYLNLILQDRETQDQYTLIVAARSVQEDPGVCSDSRSLIYRRPIER